MRYDPQESLENTINTMGTLLGVHPIVPWYKCQVNMPVPWIPLAVIGWGCQVSERVHGWFYEASPGVLRGGLINQSWGVKIGKWIITTPPKANMTTENQQFEDISPIENDDFPVPC